MNILTKKCQQCGRKYCKKPNISLKSWSIAKYCSRQCQHESLVGRPAWNKGKPNPLAKKLPHLFKKGHKSWLKGTKGVGVHGNQHHNWKEKGVSYSGIHYWIKRWKGTPRLCEHCGQTDKKRYEWANVNHKYQRILTDYIRLCTSCHRKYDINKQHAYRRR